MSQTGSDRVIIFRSADAERCRQRTLALSAVGIAFDVRQESGEFVVDVADADEERGRAELDAYDLENAETVRPRPVVFQGGSGVPAVVGFIVALVLIALAAQRELFGCDWFQAGKASAGQIQLGQWWRTVTALTLHADWAHLMTNLVVGGVVCLLTGQLLGPGLAVLSILLSGAAGNLLNALTRNPEHTSVGASTAVFAGVGLVAAQTWWGRYRHTSAMERWVPLIGGLLLLSFLGTGGERTDVAAHGWGFFCGAITGALLGTHVQAVIRRGRIQLVCGAVAMFILAASWWMALTRIAACQGAAQPH